MEIKSILNIFNKLTISSVLLTLLISIPGLILIANVFAPSENWQHLVDTVLFDYIFNSLYIMLGVAFLTSILGFTTAYITTFFNLQVQSFSIMV